MISYEKFNIQLKIPWTKVIVSATYISIVVDFGLSVRAFTFLELFVLYLEC